MKEPFPGYEEKTRALAERLTRDIERLLGEFCFEFEPMRRPAKVPSCFGGFLADADGNEQIYAYAFKTGQGVRGDFYFALSPLCGQVALTMNCAPKSPGVSALMRTTDDDLIVCARHFVVMYLGYANEIAGNTPASS